MRREIRVPPHCELHEPSRHPWRRHLRARHLSGGGRCLLPAADLPRPRGPRGARRRAQPGGGGGPRALRRPAAADRPPRGQPRDRRGLQHDRARGARRAHRDARATTIAASPIASPARSPSSTAIPTPAWSTAPPRSSTTRASRAAPGPAAIARATSSCGTWCASTTRWSTPRAWSTVASTRPSAATTRPSGSRRTSTSGCAPCAASASATSPARPLIGFRRHGENFSDESARDLEVQEVERALRTLDRRRAAARAGARARLGRHAPAGGRAPRARGPGRRLRPPRRCRCPGWRASCAPAPPACPRRRARPPNGRKIVLTSFGCNDSGGGTTVPRVAAKELARRGWDVTVFHAAVQPDPSEPALRRARMEGGRRPAGRRPQPPARAAGTWATRCASSTTRRSRAAFAALLDRVRARRRALPQPPQPRRGADRRGRRPRACRRYFSTHNYWLVCPRAYLLTGEGSICAGPGDARRELRDVRRLAARPPGPPGAPGRASASASRAASSVCLAVSDAMRAHARRAGLPGAR